MAEPLPTQHVAPPSPPAARAPGVVQALVSVLTKPASFYASVRDAGGYGAPIVFALVMGIVAGVINAVYLVVGLGAAGGAMGGAIGAAAGFGSLIMMPIFAVIGCFIGGAIVHVISLIAGGKGTFEQSVRVAGYAAAVMPIGALVGFVPLVRFLPTLYGLYLVAQGLMAIHAADRAKTYVATGVLAVLLVLFAIMGMVMGRAAQQFGSEMKTQFGEGSQFQRDMAKAREDIQRAAEEARRKQQEQQQGQPQK